MTKFRHNFVIDRKYKAVPSTRHTITEPPETDQKHYEKWVMYTQGLSYYVK